MDRLRVWFLMACLSVLLVLIGRFIGGNHGAFLFFLIAAGMNFFTYFYSDKIALKMTGSRPLAREEAPEIYAILERLTRRAGLPLPRVYLTPSLQPNAFATGRNPQHAAVAVTQGLLQLLTWQEIEGVLAHELAHIKNRDTLTGTIAATLAGAITMIADIIRWGFIFGAGRNEEEGGNPVAALALAIVAPLAALLIQMAISRAGEFRADATGARIAGSADGLASALLKLEQAARHLPMHVNPATSHLFIINPLSGESLLRLFSTHPPVSERVRRLRALAL
ncbi:heat shock protein [Thermodesulfitimonas autotrophica]|uniref:Protease HtpX homolog n=1 Tax=Thermodesulfitimonas autotrophica TaxID=1894989 RepID=A0A3N5AWV2_9THEO|nr:zinc metalloprotease HtpX [Thermodesulfitimonas autotrophica]RPF49736.1 heat shock protein [Thermodesulfitimonas autotrophica]